MCGHGTYVEIHPESLDVDLAVRRESDAVDAEECLDGEVMCQYILCRWMAILSDTMDDTDSRVSMDGISNLADGAYCARDIGCVGARHQSSFL